MRPPPRSRTRGTPADVDELEAIAELLAHPPRGVMESRMDVINIVQRAARRIRAVVDRLEVVPPPRPKAPAIPPRERREIEARRRRARAILRQPAGQGALPL